jgi:hypothetical protein
MELLRLRYQLGINLEGINAENASVIRAIANGELDTENMRANVIRIQKVLFASESLAKEAANLSLAAEALLHSS